MTRHKEAVLPVSAAIFTVKKKISTDVECKARSVQQSARHSRDWRRCPLGIYDNAKDDFTVVFQDGIWLKGRITTLWMIWMGLLLHKPKQRRSLCGERGEERLKTPDLNQLKACKTQESGPSAALPAPLLLSEGCGCRGHRFPHAPVRLKGIYTTGHSFS